MSNGITSTDNLWQYRLRQSSFHMHLVVIYTGLASAIYPGRQYKFQIITIIHFFYEHDIICIATPYNIRTRQNIWIRQILQSMNTTNFALLPRVYCIGYASGYTIYGYIFPPLPPPTRFNVGASQPDIRVLSIQHWTGGTGGAIPFKLYEITAAVP